MASIMYKKREKGGIEIDVFAALYYRLRLCDYYELPNVKESSSSFL